MIDVSSLNPLFIQIPILVVILFGILSGFKDGIFRKIFDLVLFALLIFLMVFIVPPLAIKLEQTGFIQEFVNKSFSGDMATLVSGLLTGPTYTMITSVVVLVVYGIIKLILNLFFRMIFKSKGIITRTLGAIWQLVINLAFVCVFLVVLASPSIFKGGEDLINRSVGVKELYGGVNHIQLVLKEKGLPYDLETAGAKLLAGEDATPEDLARYHSTLSRVGEILDASKNGTIVSDVYDASTNTINQEKASQLVDDVIVLSELMAKMPESARKPLLAPINNILTSATTEFLDADGNAKATITVTEEQKATLDEVLTNLGIEQATVDDLHKCIITEAVA